MPAVKSQQTFDGQREYRVERVKNGGVVVTVRPPNATEYGMIPTTDCVYAFTSASDYMSWLGEQYDAEEAASNG